MNDLRAYWSRRIAFAVLVAIAAAAVPGPAAAASSRQLTSAVHVSLAPTWFDLAEAPSLITPFMVLYGMHDALVKPMPGAPQSKSLAEAWSVSKDGLVYEFALRKGGMFAPVMEPAFLNGVGPRVATSGLEAIANFPYSAPYEDLTLKAR